MMRFCRPLTTPTAMITTRMAAKQIPSLPESFMFWKAFIAKIPVSALHRQRLTALKFGQIHFDRRGADRRAGLWIDDGEVELDAPGLGAVVELGLVDEGCVGPDLESLLVLGLVALPVIRGDRALADIEALVVHHEHLGVEAGRLGLDIEQVVGE